MYDGLKKLSFFISLIKRFDLYDNFKNNAIHIVSCNISSIGGDFINNKMFCFKPKI